jgi:hypothetical protein
MNTVQWINESLNLYAEIKEQLKMMENSFELEAKSTNCRRVNGINSGRTIAASWGRQK